MKGKIIKNRINNVGPKTELWGTHDKMFTATSSTIYTNTLLSFSKILTDIT